MISADCQQLESHHYYKPSTKTKELPIAPTILLILVMCVSPSVASEDPDQICMKDHSTDLSPTFMVNKTVCNYLGSPIKIYSFERRPKQVDKHKPDTEFCLYGVPDEKFYIIDNGNQELELVLNGTLDVLELQLQLHALKIEKKGIDFTITKQTICEIDFNLIIDDCNRVTWQTLAVIILSSLIVLLISTLAIMLILYQQKGLIARRQDDDDEINGGPPNHGTFPDNLRDTTFINPRRTSSYEFASNISRHSSSEIDKSDIHEL